MSTEIRGKSDSALEAIVKSLAKYEAAHRRAEIMAYRQNSASIRIRVIDPDFASVSRSDRHDTVWSYLEGLPDDVLSQISVLLALTPDDRAISIGTLDFDHPIPTKLY